jgi:hypothetical protein
VGKRRSKGLCMHDHVPSCGLGGRLLRWEREKVRRMVGSSRDRLGACVEGRQITNGIHRLRIPESFVLSVVSVSRERRGAW